uniref:Uncharacterized protein n=1 Tax=Tetranychus urticae TaxID=32264 RepID=T1K545_TETUR
MINQNNVQSNKVPLDETLKILFLDIKMSNMLRTHKKKSLEAQKCHKSRPILW